MQIVRYLAVAGSAWIALLLASAAVFGDDSEGRFDAALYDSAMYAPRSDKTAMTEVRFARDANPADRVREIFGQFVANEGRRGKR
jgi:hypothetical protein